MRLQKVPDVVRDGLRVRRRPRAAAHDAVVDRCELVRHTVGHVDACGRGAGRRERGEPSGRHFRLDTCHSPRIAAPTGRRPRVCPENHAAVVFHGHDGRLRRHQRSASAARVPTTALAPKPRLCGAASTPRRLTPRSTAFDRNDVPPESVIIGQRDLWSALRSWEVDSTSGPLALWRGVCISSEPPCRDDDGQSNVRLQGGRLASISGWAPPTLPSTSDAATSGTEHLPPRSQVELCSLCRQQDAHVGLWRRRGYRRTPPPNDR